MIKNENGKVEINNDTIEDTILEVLEILSETNKIMEEKTKSIFCVVTEQVLKGGIVLEDNREKNKEDMKSLINLQKVFSNLLDSIWEKKKPNENNKNE